MINIIILQCITKKIFISDSFIYSIKTHDFYADLKKNSFLFERMDTSNLPIDHPCYCVERKKLPGTFTDETNVKR